MYSSYGKGIFCSYKDCGSRNISKKSFFELPSDNRRDHWLKNSGISDEEASRIILYRRPIWLCEDHFEPKCMQYLPDGRKILIQHPCSVPVPYTANKQTQKMIDVHHASSGTLGTGGFSYDETATQMLHLFEAGGGNESDLHDYFLARNYIQQSAAADQSVTSNEQQQQLLQNYMLQAQLQQSQLFFSQPTTAVVQAPSAAAAAASIVQTQVGGGGGGLATTTSTQPTQIHQHQQVRKPRSYNRAPRNTYIEEEPEQPKREVMCYSVQGGERQKTAQKSSDAPSDDIEDMLDTFFIVNDKNPQQTTNGTSSGSGGGGGMILGN